MEFGDIRQGRKRVSQTLIGIFLDAVGRHRKADQFLRKRPHGWETISAERALKDVESLALGLRALGVAAGDRVLLVSETRYEWPIADLAILGLGAVTVPVYPSLTAAQVRTILENAGARVAIVSSALQLGKLRDIGSTTLEQIVHMDEAPAAGVNDVSWVSLLERGSDLRRGDPLAFRTSAERVRPEDLATIIYTSGTTGEPKGAMLTHGNVASNVRACLQVLPIGPGDRCLSFLPLCHIFERMAGLYTMMAAGVTIAYAESFDTVAANLVEVRPTIMSGVPRFYEKVHASVVSARAAMPAWRQRMFDWGVAQGLEKARAHFEGREIGGLGMWLADWLVTSKIRRRTGGRLRYCLSGGAPLPSDVMEFFFAIGIAMLEGYGLTETSPVICMNPPGRERPGSVGLPVPGVEVKIGEGGEILTRGPHVMRGYYRNPTATEAALRDGWFHTGDIGRIDEGYLVITDRLKDLLVTAGGKKVAPQPIEARLKAGKWISEAVLVGDGRPCVVAMLVPNFARLEAEAKARDWPTECAAARLARPEVRGLFQAEVARVNVDLAPFESIKQFALLERELTQERGELTPTLKVKRRAVVQSFASTIESLYAGPRVPRVA
jgi:long-chain acyl-CoA synthetase